MEYWFPIAVALFALLLAVLPILRAYEKEDAELQFMGLIGRDVVALNGYMMLSRQAQDGDHLFENKLTHESTQRTFFNLEWWLIGNTARVKGVSLLVAHRIFHGLTAILLMCAIYALISECTRKLFLRRLILLLCAFGSGFGWINVLATKLLRATSIWEGSAVVHQLGRTFEGLLFYPTPDLIATSIFGLTLTEPHFARAMAFGTLTWVFVLVGERTSKRRYFVLSGLSAWAHFIVRPYGIPIVYATFLLYPVVLWIRDRHFRAARWKNVALAAFIPLPQILYYGYLVLGDILAASGPDLPSFSFVLNIVWLGWPFLLCLATLPGVFPLRERSTPTIVVGLWLIATFFVGQSYPFYKSGQEAVLAYHVVPPILATIGPLCWLARWFRRSKLSSSLAETGIAYPVQRTLLAAMILLLSIPSSIYCYRYLFTRSDSPSGPHFLNRDVAEAMHWLDENASRESLVLSRAEFGHFIPRMAVTKSYNGHYMLTRAAHDKERRAADYLEFRQGEHEMRNFARAHGISYLLAGPNDVAILRERAFDWMVEVYGRKNAAVFRLDLWPKR